MKAVEPTFNQKLAEKHLNKLLRQYGITVVQWSAGSNGFASFKQSKIKIPKPTNIDRFCVCMHEIKHIIDGKPKTTYLGEFECDMWAREQAVSLGFDVTKWDKRTYIHTLWYLAKAFNRGTNSSRIPAKIKEWIGDRVDFSTWDGKKVYMYTTKSNEEGFYVVLKSDPKLICV